MKTTALILVSTFFLSLQMMAQKTEYSAKPTLFDQNKKCNSITKRVIKKTPYVSIIAPHDLPNTPVPIVRFIPKPAPSPK